MISNGIQDESAPKIVDYYDVTEAAWSSSVTNLPCLIACRRENASGVACLFHKREIAVKHVGEVNMIGRKHPKTLNHLSCQMYILYHYTVWLFKQTVLVWDPGVGSVFVSLIQNQSTFWETIVEKQTEGAWTRLFWNGLCWSLSFEWNAMCRASARERSCSKKMVCLTMCYEFLFK